MKMKVSSSRHPPRMAVNGETRVHKNLNGLDFQSSGHTGFQKELTQEQLDNIAAVQNKADTVYVDSEIQKVILETINKIDEAFDAGRVDANSEHWDIIQDDGERRDYSYAFANWRASKITPKHIIKAEKIMYAFINCKQLTDCSDIIIEVISSAPQMMYVFTNCVKMIFPPTINISAAIVKTYISMYAGCQSLESVKVYWGNGTSDPVTQRNSCQNMFFKCYSLKEIDFGAENTGSPLNLDLSYAADLSTASVSSLLNSLQTIPEGSSGKHEITIASQLYEKIETENPELINGFVTKGWTILHKDNQPNTESEE